MYLSWLRGVILDMYSETGGGGSGATASHFESGASNEFCHSPKSSAKDQKTSPPSNFRNVTGPWFVISMCVYKQFNI